MAKAIVYKCQSCGGPLNVSAKGGKFVCPFCGTINLFEAEQKTANEVTCPKCGARNDKGAVHCSECGEKLIIQCPKCGTGNAAGSPYCIRCGVNFQEEDDRRRISEADRLQQEIQKTQPAAIRKKRVIIFLSIFLLISCFICSIVFYAGNLSPSAKATATAEVIAVQQATRDTIQQLKDQYPYNGSNGIYGVYVKSFCVGQDRVSKDWYVITHFLYYPERTEILFDWNFINSYMTDNLGNTFPGTYETSDYNSARVDTKFDPNASSVTLHIRLKVKDIAEIPIEIDITDPVLIGNCH
jgi:predicted RNA-binding Zn-ribbon protein involved in translation (DUF1610 family)